MSIYRIADLYIDIEPHYEYTYRQLLPYTADTQSAKADITVRLTKQLLLDESKYAPGLAEPYYESIAIYRQICLSVLKSFNGLFFHCSALAVNNEAYIFTAQSGTGKSTHARMWREAFGDDVVMINDDKPIIRLIDGVFYVYGTPWDGKHSLSSNIKVPLKAICFLKRGEQNEITQVNGTDWLSFVLNQTIVPKDTQSMNNLLDMFEKMLTEVKTYELHCNISHEAAKIAYEFMK